MKADNSVPTVFDVAREAGVSRGTVDRVIHNRGRVSEDAVSRVKDAIARLGYTVNPNAMLLASRKAYTIACLIPQFRPGEYWSLISKGLQEGAKSLQGYNVSVQLYLYNSTDIDSFRVQSARVLEDRPSGVILNAVFREAVTAFSEVLDGAGIPYAFIDNKVDGLGNVLYYGIAPYRSGYLGAYLLTLKGDVRDVALIRITRDKGSHADPNGPRREGFMDFIGEHFPDCTIHTVFIRPDSPADILSTLEHFFGTHPEVRHLAMTNSRVHLLSEYLRLHPSEDRITIGFDDLEKNMEALRAGYIDFLVTPHIEQQARLAITSFSEVLVWKRKPVRRNCYVHLDILNRYNLDDYND